MTASEYLHMIQDRRRTNLARLVEARGTQTAIAKQIGRTCSNISHLIAGRHHFNERQARLIEQKLSLGYGALDLEN